MKTDIDGLMENVKWQDLTPGCSIRGGRTADSFETGQWRTDSPRFNEGKCCQCLLCVPVCPDSAIPVKDGQRGDFDFMHCKGCGICARVCPFDAIRMKVGER